MESRNGWWLGPVIASAFLLGLAGASTAGYYVRDDSKPLSGYDRAPECPQGFEPNFFGVTWDGKMWEPIYTCTLVGPGAANPTPVSPADFTQTPTPEPRPS